MRLSERCKSEFRNFGVMSAGKTKILRKKWKKITRYPGLQLPNRTVLDIFSNFWGQPDSPKEIGIVYPEFAGLLNSYTIVQEAVRKSQFFTINRV